MTREEAIYMAVKRCYTLEQLRAWNGEPGKVLLIKNEEINDAFHHIMDNAS